MRFNLKILLPVLAILIALPAVASTGSSAEKLRKARILMSDYQDASTFRDMNDGHYDPSWEDIFRNLFRTNTIVFDVPLRVDSRRYRQGHFEPEQGGEAQLISLFQEMVTIERYIETIRNAYDLFSITDFSYQFIETGFDTLNLASQGIILFEFRKIFPHTYWSVADSRSYLYEVRFFDSKPYIASIRAIDQNIPKSELVLRFVNALSEWEIPDVTSQIRFIFDESIYNSSLNARTDSLGQIRPGLIANKATVRIDTVLSFDGHRYSLPDDWRNEGFRVSAQPAAGFRIALRPWRWNGFSWSVTGYGGMINQSRSHLPNFMPGTDFTNKAGYKYALGLEVGKLFNLNEISSFLGGSKTGSQPQANPARRNTFIGFASGISLHQFRYQITSNGFQQLPYHYIDRREEPLLVYVSGHSFEENVSVTGVNVPLLLEFRRLLPAGNLQLKAYSFQAGVNLMFPFETRFDMNGTFSRHGFYEQFNSQFMLNDEFYNYYTERDKSYAGNIVNNEILPSLMLKANAYFKSPFGRPDDLIHLGIQFTAPFGSGNTNDPGRFFLASENDVFSSLSKTKREVYAHFIGLSIGYNFIRYRIQ